MHLSPVVSGGLQRFGTFTSLVVAEQQLHLLVRAAQKFVLVNSSWSATGWASQDLIEDKMELIGRLKDWLNMLLAYEPATNRRREHFREAEMIQRMRILARCVLHSLQSLYVHEQKSNMITASLDNEARVSHQQRQFARTAAIAIMLSGRHSGSVLALAHLTDDILHADAMKVIHTTNLL